MNFDSVSSFEIINHIGSGFLISMIKDVVLGVHVPLDLVHFVGTVRPILGHHDGAFKFSIDEICIMFMKSILY